MEDITTTDAPIVEAGAEQAQPAEQPDTSAASQPQEPATIDEPSTDENLDWLRNKGIDPDSPEAISKIAEMARNAEKKMHESTTKASALERSLTEPAADFQPQDQSSIEALAAKVQAMELSQKVNTFFSENPEAKSLEAKMTEIVTTRPEIGQLVTQGYLSLQDLHALARDGDTGREAQLKQDGGREALEKVAAKQQAKAIQGNAVSSEIPTSNVTRANVEEWFAGLSSDERAKPETQKMLNCLLS